MESGLTYATAQRFTETLSLGPMPTARWMTTRDPGHARAPVSDVFNVVRNVEEWPTHLPHYRWVRMLERDAEGGGIVEMAADRPFGHLHWPTFWRSLMQVDHSRPAVRFRHIGGLTTGMDVEWAFEAVAATATEPASTRILLLHMWDGPRWPLIGRLAAVNVIGPVFVHGIASRTVAGLARVAELRS